MTEYERLAAKNGSPTIRATCAAGRKVFLHSSYDPEREAQNWARQVTFQESDVLVVFGLGLGYHLLALAERLSPLNRVIVFEPSPQLCRPEELPAEVRGFLSQNVVQVTGTLEEFSRAFRKLEERWTGVSLLKWPASIEVDPEVFEQFVERLRAESVTLLSDRVTTLRFSRRWHENFFRNLSFIGISAPIAGTFNQFKGVPAIVVSAGPSLADSLETLREVQERALILAVGTVARLLVREGIRPDVILSFDPGEANYSQHFEGTSFSEIPLVYAPGVHHRVVETYDGPLSLMVILEPDLWLERVLGQTIGLVDSGPSIANTAFDLATRMGADPILFVGQDLSYRQRQTHVKGTHADDFDYFAPDSEQMIEVAGIKGERAYTTFKMLTYIRWFEDHVRSLAPDRTILNCTTRGASIAGTLEVSLQEAAGDFDVCRGREAKARLAKALRRPPDFDVDRLVRYLEKGLEDLKSVRAWCRKGRRLSRKLVRHFSGGTSCPVERTMRQLERLDRAIEARSEKFILANYLLSPVLQILNTLSESEDESKAEAVARGEQFYSELEKVLSFAIPHLERCLRLLKKQRMSAGERRPLAAGSNS